MYGVSRSLRRLFGGAPEAMWELRGYADARLFGRDCLYCSVVIDMMKYINAGINDASQEVFSTCEPLGVIV